MNAGRDQNHVPTIICVLNTDGSTITPLVANPTNHGLKISDGTTGTDHGTPNAKRDENDVHAWVAESSVGDGSLVTVYADSAGSLLTKST